MADQFNPYTEWFGIAPEQQPPNHYVMLGLKEFESDAKLIDEAAEKRAMFLQDVANGPHTKASQELLNLVATARLCLMDVDRKSEYDSLLKNPPAPEKNPAFKSRRKRAWAKSGATGSTARRNAAHDQSETALDDELDSMRESETTATTGSSINPPPIPPPVIPVKAETISPPKQDSQFAINVGKSASLSGSFSALPPGVKNLDPPSAHDPQRDAKDEKQKTGPNRGILIALGIVGVLSIGAIGGVIAMTGSEDKSSSQNGASVSDADSETDNGATSGRATTKRDRTVRSGVVSTSIGNGTDSTAADNKTLQETDAGKRNASSGGKNSGKARKGKQSSKSGKGTGKQNNQNKGPTKRPANWPPTNDGMVSKEGLVLWFDAGDMNTIKKDDERKISVWSDKSGKGHDAFQPQGNNQPQFSGLLLNGRPVVVFKRQGKSFLTISHAPPLNFGKQYTIATVGAGNKGVMISKGLPHSDMPNSFSLNDSLSRLRLGKSDYIEAGESAEESERFRCRILIADDNAVKWHVDEHAGSPDKKSHHVENDNPMVIGKRDTRSAEYADMRLAELLIYNRPLNDKEIKQLQDYLNKKWLAD